MLDEISGGVDAAKWVPMSQDGPSTGDPQRRSMDSYVAQFGVWRILVVRYATGSDHAPYGYDGAATKEGVVLRLTRPLAERCFELAQKKDT